MALYCMTPVLAVHDSQMNASSGVTLLDSDLVLDRLPKSY